MERCDGFIVDIFNYCDRWCETCALTSRCRLFADVAHREAMLDPGFRAIVDSPPRAQPVLPPPAWMEELIEQIEANDNSEVVEDAAARGDEIAPQHLPIQEHAVAYALRVHHWLRRDVWPEIDHVRRDPRDAISVIAWFASLNRAKIRRALVGLAAFDGDREFPPDHEGSAKVALIGIERSQKAWMQLVADGRVTMEVALPFVEELLWLLEKLDDEFPRARAFVRPGFDDPGADALAFSD
jgi:hypothetical protein